MTTPPAQLASKELVRAPEPFERDQVEELLRLFGKAARAHQLYLPNNPVYKTAHDALRAGFLPIWEAGGELVLGFTENEVKWEGETVLEESTRSSDSLPWIFYKDGVREVRMLRGFECEELDRLLDILQRVRKASPDEDDLLTMLWEGDFSSLRYRYVDLTVDASAPLADGGEATRSDRVDPRALLEEEEESAPAARPGVVNMADFDGTLYFLDEREIEYLQHEVAREYEYDVRQNVVSMLLDIFEQQRDPAVRDETAGILDGLLIQMLSAGEFQNVSFLIRESLLAVQRAVDLLPEQRTRLTVLPVRLSAPEALTQLLQLLDEASHLPPAVELLELFEQLQPTALGTVLEWLGRLQNPRLRPLLEQAAGRLAAQNTAELVRLILSPSASVAHEAIKRAGALRTPAAVTPLARILADGEAELRVASVQALSEIGSPGALQSLERAVDDRDRDVRVAAVRALQGRGYRPVLPRLETIVKSKAIRDADLTEKMAVFEAYGSLCGEAGVSALDAMLNGNGTAFAQGIQLPRRYGVFFFAGEGAH